MFALLFAPFAALWSADNADFFKQMTNTEWEYVGVQERQTNGLQKDGSAAMTVEVDGKRFILFKQRPADTRPAAWETADNAN